MAIDNEHTEEFNAHHGTACGRCGADPAPGQAALNHVRLCHHDDPDAPETDEKTCYEQRIAELTAVD